MATSLGTFIACVVQHCLSLLFMVLFFLNWLRSKHERITNSRLGWKLLRFALIIKCCGDFLIPFKYYFHPSALLPSALLEFSVLIARLFVHSLSFAIVALVSFRVLNLYHRITKTFHKVPCYLIVLLMNGILFDAVFVVLFAFMNNTFFHTSPKYQIPRHTFIYLFAPGLITMLLLIVMWISYLKCIINIRCKSSLYNDKLLANNTPQQIQYIHMMYPRMIAMNIGCILYRINLLSVCIYLLFCAHDGLYIEHNLFAIINIEIIGYTIFGAMLCYYLMPRNPSDTQAVIDLNILSNAIKKEDAPNNTSSLCNSIDSCSYVLILMKVLAQRSTNHDITLLNAFQHCLSEHDDEFEAIYNRLDPCDVARCDAQKRLYVKDRERDIEDMAAERVFDCIYHQIHCHYLHCFDIGHRFTEAEINEMNKTTQEDTNMDNQYSRNCSLQTGYRILSDKQSRHRLYRDDGNEPTHTKFNQLSDCKPIMVPMKNTNCDDIKYDHEQHKRKPEHQLYSFGVKYYYWDCYKNSPKDPDENWYICPKYESFKDELTNNKYNCLNVEQWNYEASKATKYLMTNNAKKLISNDDYVYGITLGATIQLQHLLSVIIYCDYTELSYVFSGTFRRLNNGAESDEAIKQRHSAFVHLSRYLVEAVNVFGVTAENASITAFYHGVCDQMLFNGMDFILNGPLSTTSSWSVAVQFSDNQGMILELNPYRQLKYFACAWLSGFSNEAELLYISCQHHLTFVNITDAPQGLDFKLYIQSLAIIDTMTNGLYFNSDNKTIYRNWFNDTQPQKLQNTTLKAIPGLMLNKSLQATDQVLNTNYFDNYLIKKGDKIDNPLLHGAEPITDLSKLVTAKLIEHELNKYGNSSIPEYIDKLMHNICVHKTELIINWHSMNVEVYNGDIMDYDDDTCGYQGYLFLYHLFCMDEYSIIDFIAFNSLYPNITHIKIHQLPVISSKTLQYILRCLSNPNKPTNINEIRLILRKPSDIDLNELFKPLRTQFKEIGFVVFHVWQQTIVIGVI